MYSSLAKSLRPFVVLATLFGCVVEVQAVDLFDEESLKYKPKIFSEQFVTSKEMDNQGSSLSYSTDLPNVQRPVWNLMIDVGAGHSSNIAKFVGSPEADFTQLYQSFDLNKQINESLNLYIKQSAFLRHFNLPDTDENFKNNFLNGEVGVTTPLSPSWDLGFAADGEHYRGREVDFRDNMTTGLDYQTYTVGGAALLRRYGKTSMTELKARREILRALTETFDEFGNRFKNSHDAIEVGIKYGDALSRDFSWETSYNFQFRKYLERRARLADGGISPNFDTEFLLENYHKVSLAGFYRRLKIQAGLNYIEDRIDGAETRAVPYAEVSLPFNITKYFFITPQARWESANYLNFKADILNDPDAEDLRQDQNWTGGVDVSLVLGKVQPTFSVRRNKTDTNYKIFEYEEDVVMGGLRGFF